MYRQSGQVEMDMGRLPLKDERAASAHPNTDKGGKEPDRAETTIRFGKQNDENNQQMLRPATASFPNMEEASKSG